MRRTMRMFFGAGDEEGFRAGLESARSCFLFGDVLAYSTTIGGSSFIKVEVDYDDQSEAGVRAVDHIANRAYSGPSLADMGAPRVEQRSSPSVHVFYPVRITRNAAGDVVEESVPYGDWPEWALAAIGWLSVKCPACGVTPENGKAVHMSDCRFYEDDPIPYRLTEAGRAMLRDAQQGAE